MRSTRKSVNRLQRQPETRKSNMSGRPQTRQHSIQARFSEADPRLYNVNRDVAHNFKQVANMVAGRLEDRLWPALAGVLDREHITDDDLGIACQAFCLFVATSAENPDEDMSQAMWRSGWFDVKPVAQVAVMAILGTVLLGYHFAGVREATLAGQGPAMELKDLAARGEECARLLSLPRWKRSLYLWKTRFGAAWNALVSRRGT